MNVTKDINSYILSTPTNGVKNS